jgi:hypothetical protein
MGAGTSFLAIRRLETCGPTGMRYYYISELRALKREALNFATKIFEYAPQTAEANTSCNYSNPYVPGKEEVRTNSFKSDRMHYREVLATTFGLSATT